MRNRSGYSNRREAAIRKENERHQAAVQRAADTIAHLEESLDSDPLLTLN